MDPMPPMGSPPIGRSPSEMSYTTSDAQQQAHPAQLQHLQQMQHQKHQNGPQPPPPGPGPNPNEPVIEPIKLVKVCSTPTLVLNLVKGQFWKE